MQGNRHCSRISRLAEYSPDRPTVEMTVGVASQNSTAALLSRNLAVKVPTLSHHLGFSPHPPTLRLSQLSPPCIFPPVNLLPTHRATPFQALHPRIFFLSQPRGRLTVSNRSRWSLRAGLWTLAVAGVSPGCEGSHWVVLRTCPSWMATLMTAKADSVEDWRRPRPVSGDARPGRCGA